MLLRRDRGMCQFPGCEATHRLHAHHVVHWTNGGPTELSNLISLCHFHHHSVHGGGWNITQGTTGDRKVTGWVFIDPDGNRYSVPILRLPTREPLPETSKNGTAAPLGASGERCDIHYAADVLLTNTVLQRNLSG